MSLPFELAITAPGRGLLVRGLPARSTAQRATPVLAATALRGALRESLEAILRGAGEPACSGGSGLDPTAHAHAPTTHDAPTTHEVGALPAGCALDGGQPCRACRLFGGSRARVEPGARGVSTLVLADALAPAGELRWHAGGGVALRRPQRSSAPGRRHEYPLLALEGSLLAHGRLLDPELAPLLEAAVRATKHVGAGRGRGAGRIELDLRWLEEETPAAAAELPAGDALAVRVRLAAPAAFGTAAARRDWRDTRREIPGSALRGAIGFALAERLAQPDDPALAALVDERHGARFGFLYPARRGGAADALAAPWPITARTCSAAGLEHGVFDTLLDRVRAACAATPEDTERAWSARASGCSRCAAPLEPPPGTRGSPLAPRTRLRARARLDRTRSSSDDSSVSVEEWLDAQSELSFEGTIEGIPETSRALLAQALAAPLALGRATALGRGRVQLEVAPPPRRDALESRGFAFEEALRGSLAAIQLDAAPAEQVVPITLLSPLIPERADSDGREELAAALGASAVEWIVAARRFVAEGGFDQRSGESSAALAVAAGSVFAARLPDGWRARIRDLTRLEREGAGARRHQGYGRLLCFDPLIWQKSIGESPQ